MVVNTVLGTNETRPGTARTLHPEGWKPSCNKRHAVLSAGQHGTGVLTAGVLQNLIHHCLC
jgi:hypothetical protein